MKLCINCVHAAENSAGVYCTALKVEIWDETVAETCGLFKTEEDQDDERGVA